MTVKNIKELFRSYSNLDSGEISDDDFADWVLPQAAAYYKLITDETVSYGTAGVLTTGDFMLDAILAEGSAYFAYHTQYHNHVEVNTATEFRPALFKYQIHEQKMLKLMYMYKPSFIIYDEKRDKFYIADKYKRTNFIAIQDNGD